MLKIELFPKEDRNKTFCIHINDEEWGEIHTNLYGRKPSLPKCHNSLDEFEAQFFELEYQLSKNYALKCLSRRSLPSALLRKKLEDILVTEHTIQRVLKECIRLGYLNDADWVDRFIQYQTSRNQGPKSIAMKLRNKGISQEIAEEAISRSNCYEEQEKRILALLNTKYKNRALSDFKTREKVIAALIRKGFTFSDIKKALQSASYGRKWSEIDENGH